MRLWHSPTPGAWLILGLNSVLTAILVVVAIRLIWPAPKAGSSPETVSKNLIRQLMAESSDSSLSLLDSELQTAERDTYLITEIASHIFSHPESFRLAAQPGEYDYDRASGLYGTVQNDGSTVLLLSSGTPLSPEILHDIRLSEYLNPIFKSVLSLKPAYLEIGLYTADSLIRCYPWFDAKQRMVTGDLRRDFKNGEMAFFERARPEKDPLKKPVWTLSRITDQKPARLMCSAPFESGGAFKGVIALTVSLDAVVEKSLSATVLEGQVSLILGERNQILGMSAADDSRLRARIMDICRQLPQSGGPPFEQLADFYVQFSSSKVAPLRLVSLLGDVQAIKLGLSPPVPVTSQTRPWITAGILISLLVLLLNSAVALRTQPPPDNSKNELSRALTALADLKLDEALTNGSGSLFEQFDRTVRSLKARLEQLPTDKPPQAPETTPIFDNAAELETISAKFSVLDCFDSALSVPVCLSRLLEVIADLSKAQRIWFMFYSPTEQVFRSSAVSLGVSSEILEASTIGSKEWGLFEQALNSSDVVCANSLTDVSFGSDVLAKLISRNVLVCPILDQRATFALLILSDKRDDFSEQDRARIAALQQPISRVLRDLLQCEGYRNIDRLRRQYCEELSGAIETPLNRIRSEVQSIYSRLGRLTPYYKQHCETILFEVGRLYEIAHEASTADLDPGKAFDG
jgi:hypothetical protein